MLFNVFVRFYLTNILHKFNAMFIWLWNCDTDAWRHNAIVCSHCAAYCMDLLLKDIGELPWSSGVIDRGRVAVKLSKTTTNRLLCFSSIRYWNY